MDPARRAEDDVVKERLPRTVAPAYANLILLPEMAMGVGLLIGALLARMRRFRVHAGCQSAIGVNFRKPLARCEQQTGLAQ